MAVAYNNFDRFSIATQNANAGSHTTAGSNRVLVVGVCLYTNFTGSMTTISYNGVALTKLGTITNGINRTELWYLIGPASGSNVLAYTSAGFGQKLFHVLSVTGANAVDTLTTETAHLFTAVASATNNLVFGVWELSASSSAKTPKAGVTETDDGIDGDWSGYIAGGASVTVGADDDGNTFAGAACNIVAGTQAVPNYNFLAFM